MEVAKINSNQQIDFPPRIKEWLKKEKELAVYLKGDTLLLKKIVSPELSSVAERDNAQPISMDEIVNEVRQYREEKRKKS